MKNITQRQWFMITSAFAFASVISFFNINSTWADENDFNGLLGFAGTGIIFGLLAAYSLYRTKN
jgi:hypothetical protein